MVLAKYQQKGTCTRLLAEVDGIATHLPLLLPSRNLLWQLQFPTRKAHHSNILQYRNGPNGQGKQAVLERLSLFVILYKLK
jgi:hypothetical protein